MKRNIPVPVFVLALLIGQLSCIAQPPRTAQPPLPGYYRGVTVPPAGSNSSLVPSKYSLQKFSPIRFPYSVSQL